MNNIVAFCSNQSFSFLGIILNINVECFESKRIKTLGKLYYALKLTPRTMYFSPEREAAPLTDDISPAAQVHNSLMLVLLGLPIWPIWPWIHGITLYVCLVQVQVHSCSMILSVYFQIFPWICGFTFCMCLIQVQVQNTVVL